ncbi:MAG: ANTAR domain-containing protein [Oscillospiraceae bacterium]|nr:ANTAR domain-containing protein [Oscillospiraceae bacterium]
MDSVLIVSCSGKGTDFFSELLNSAGFHHIAVTQSCGEARRLLLTRDYDLVVVNAPLRDESGENLSRQIASRGISQAMLVVKSEHFEAVSAVCEDDGVLTVAKPVNRAVFWSALKLAGASQNRLRRVQAENAKLKQKIEDIRVVDRAKCLLISHMSMSENDAHRFIEKQAMDMRLGKKEIAERILKTYEA